MKCKVGDKVVGIENAFQDEVANLSGEVVDIWVEEEDSELVEELDWFLVDFGANFKGHNGEHNDWTEGTKWWVREDNLEVVNV